MSAFAGRRRAMQVDDDAFDADGGGGDREFDLAKLIKTTMVLIIVDW